jgi:hypothetical protein
MTLFVANEREVESSTDEREMRSGKVCEELRRFDELLTTLFLLT